MKRVKTKENRPVTTKDYETLGKSLEAVYDTLNPSRGSVYRTAFLKGVFAGVGGVIGATLVITLLLWILSLFDSIPFIGGFFESLQESIKPDKAK
jgi:hypothetical protein